MSFRRLKAIDDIFDDISKKTNNRLIIKPDR